jgi:hypothetical protein
VTRAGWSYPAAALAAGLGLLGAAVTPAAGASAGPWSAPATLSSCAGPAAPQVVFPARSPFTPTGPGEIAFQSCSSGTVLQPVPGAGGVRRVLPALLLPDTMQGTTDGKALLAGPVSGGGSGLAESSAPDPPLRLGGLPVASAHGYLGDVATAASTGDGIVLRMQRWYRHAPGPPRRMHGGPGPGGALVVTLDYRADVLLVWSRQGSLFEREITNKGTVERAERIGAAGDDPQPTAVISDDDRAIVAWTAADRLWLSVSGPHVRFGLPRSIGLSSRAPQLVRLSGEAVALVWTDGGGAVEIAPLTLAGVGPATTLAPAVDDARVLAVTTGPHNDVLTLWSAFGGLAARRWTPGGAGPTEAIAATGVPGNTELALAIDPGNDAALAVWRAPGSGEPLIYATREMGEGPGSPT